ncbi:MAG: GNAT family N-acetyltransferase [Chloroflexota bacterium]|nr:GNAT family N-acetyltransferase [Chloroflexota bacterium]
MSTPELHLSTAFNLNGKGRITSTREPGAQRGPLFALVRSATQCAWAVRADIPQDLARELDHLAHDEPPALDLRDAPVQAERYVSLLRDRIGSSHDALTKSSQSDGPLFAFPDAVAQPVAVVVIEDEQLLAHHFRGWVAGEIAAGRAPVLAVVEASYPVSVCFCARRSDVAAEAGLETAAPFRGRGYAPRVTAAWAVAIRSSGRIPLYSTAWTNTASLAVARKLGLIAYASTWSLSD